MGNRSKREKLVADFADAARNVDPDRAVRIARQARRDGLGEDVDAIADQLAQRGLGHVADRLR